MIIKRTAEKNNGGGFTLLDEGKYDMVLLQLTQGKSKSSGKDMTILEFKVEDTNVRLKEYIVDTNAFKWDQIFESYGFDVSPGSTYEYNTDDIHGKSCRAYIKQEPFKKENGEISYSNKIDYYIPPQSGNVSVKSSDDPF